MPGRQAGDGADRLLRQLVGRPQPAAHAVRARAQRDLRPAQALQPGVGRRRCSTARAGQRGADGQDPHGRMDAGDPAPSGAPDRHEGELVGPRDRAPARAFGRISENEAFGGMPARGGRPPRRRILPDRGVRHRLPAAPAHPRRLPVARRPTGACSRRAGDRGGDRQLDQLGVFHSKDWDFTDLLYSFGVTNPGAITLHNYPNFLRSLIRPDGGVIDLARSTSCATANAACRATTGSSS